MGVKVQGLDQAIVMLARVAKRVDDTSVLLNKALILVFQAIQRKFQTSGAYDGSNWAPLKPATVKRKLGLGGTAMPLIGAGKNAGALRQQWDFEVMTKTRALLRSRVDYGWYHEVGAGHNPQRQISPQAYLLKEIGVKVGTDFAVEVTH